MLHQRNVVVDSFRSTDGWWRNQDCSADLACDEVRHLSLVVGLLNDHPRTGGLGILDHLEDVRRRWRNARFRLHECDDLHPGVCREVAPARMIGDYRLAADCRKLGLPSLLGGVETILERLFIFLILILVPAIELTEPLLEQPRDSTSVFRIEPVVWIAK